MNTGYLNLYFEILSFFYIIQKKDMIKNFKKDFFTQPTIKAIFNYVKDFIVEYKVEPTVDQIIEVLRVNEKLEEIPEDSVRELWKNHDNINRFDESWLMENVKNWGEWQSFYNGLINVVSYVKTLPQETSYPDCAQYIAKAKTIWASGCSFTVNDSSGHDFFDPETHRLTLLNTRTSGYHFMDLCLNGGLSNKQLIVLMGGPKSGKSMWLCNLAAQSVRNGYNTAYITLEMSYQKVSQRIGSNLFDIDIDNYKKASEDTNYMNAKIKAFHMNNIKPAGSFIIEEYPTSTATADDLEAFLLKKEESLSTETKPFKFNNIYIDYINIMADKKNPNSENTYLKIKSICEDVRAMAQRNDWCVISVTQTNKLGMEASDITMTNVSESSGLIATVDALFGIIRTPQMRANNCYYLKGVALRDSPYMGDRKKFLFDGHHLRLEEDKNEPIIQENMEIPQNLQAPEKQLFAANPTTTPRQIIQPSMPILGMPTPGETSVAAEASITGKNLFNV